MTIDLQQFCTSPEDIMRYDMSKPWIDGTWRYATNSRIIVRVPAESADKPDDVPDAGYLFKDFRAEHCTEELPKWDGSMYEYQEECEFPQCHDGKISGGKNECEECGGKGWTPESVPTTVIFQGFNFQGSYLQKIHDLPGSRGHVRDRSLAGHAPTGQLNFIFDDGGQGLLMNITNIVTTEGIDRSWQDLMNYWPLERLA